MKIEIEVSERCEATRAPYWLTISPRQNFETNERGLHNIASMITGPFFSRMEADRIVESQPHRFGSTSYVFCCSGHNTIQYAKATKCLGMDKPTVRRKGHSRLTVKDINLEEANFI